MSSFSDLLSERSIKTMPQFILECIGYLLPMICIPMAIHGNIKLYKQRTEIYVKKRYSLFYLNTAIIFTMLIFTLVEISFLHLSTIVQAIVMIFYLIAWYILLYFLCVRTWIIYYACNWTTRSMERKWKYIINPKVAEDDKYIWMMQNSDKYGNVEYVRKVVAFVLIFGLLIGTASGIIGLFHSSHSIVMIAIVMMIIAVLVPVLLYAVIVFKTPTYYDIYNIHWESRMHSKLVILLMIVCTIYSLTLGFTGNSNNMVFIWPFSMLTLYAMSHISTYSIYNKNASQLDIECHVPQESNDNITLDMMLTDKNALQLFAEHLSKEFSLECLLSVIEFNDLQKYIIEVMEEEEEEDEMKEMESKDILLYKFPSNVPMSEIIEREEHPIINHNHTFKAKVKARNIYKRYVEGGAELEINISNQQRRECKKSLHDLPRLLSPDINLLDLVVLFQDAKMRMVQLLNYSLHRLKLDSNTSLSKVQSLFADEFP